MEILETLVNTATNGSLHESFHKDSKDQFTRDWFAWPNALFAELVQTTGRSCGTAETAPELPEVKERPDHRKLGSCSEFYFADVKTLRYRSIPGLDLKLDA